MKQNNIFHAVMTAVICWLGGTSTANATAWRVNHDTTTGAHFASIAEAVSSSDVEPGDTLYLDPGLITSAKISISKQLTIIGTGYLRASSPHQFAHVSHEMTITAEGTKIEGLWCFTLNLNAPNITIERCYITGNITTDKATNTGINIRQCYISSSNSSNLIYGGSSRYLTNATIENNIIKTSGSSANSPIRYLNGCTIRNNYIQYNGSSKSYYVLQNVTNSAIYNNVLLNSQSPEQVLSSVTNKPHHNIYSSSTTDDESHNYGLGSADESLVFSMSGNNDERYSELKDDSPAIGFGDGGTDCGPSGGLYPYIPGGLPAYHPYYTNAVISKTTDGTGINVSLKIKMQNE